MLIFYGQTELLMTYEQVNSMFAVSQKFWANQRTKIKYRVKKI